MSKCVLGIDVGKKELNLALLKDDHFFEKSVSNSPAGFEKLLRFLNNYNVIDVKCYLESTGSYSEAIADFLFDQKITVTVVNPYKIASFSKSKLSRIKTDKKDAKLIAEYGGISNDKPYEKPSEILRCIRALYRTYLKQTQMSSACKNQIEHATVYDDKIIWQKTLDEFKNNCTEIVNRIIELINSDEKIKLQFNKLQTIDGVAKITAIAIIAEIQSVERFENARQMIAYCGLTPKIRESGTSVRGKPRISKQGNKILRNALYFPAMVASRHCECFRRYRQKLLARGKAKKQIIVVIMKKILLAAYGILKYEAAFNPNLLFRNS